MGVTFVQALRKRSIALRTCVKRFFRTEVLVLGDSHATVFHARAFKSAFRQCFFNVVAVGGATVSGLENPNSKTLAYPIFLSELRRAKARLVIVLLGEVDTGFVIWYRAQKYNSSTEAMLNKAILNYQRLLGAISKQAKVVCISTPLPTISDDNNWGDVANARKDVRATQRDRTVLTLRFNRLMKEYCTGNGMAFVDLDRESLGNNGLVRADLLNADSNDHHYAVDKYADLLISRIRSIINDHIAAEKAGSAGRFAP